MSIVIETFLVCDKCGENFGIDNRHQSGAAHRANAGTIRMDIERQ